jgi:Flp pilus assembly CpaE family ATPase
MLLTELNYLKPFQKCDTSLVHLKKKLLIQPLINFSSEKENVADREKDAEIARIEIKKADLRATEKEAKKEKGAEVARETEDEEEDQDQKNGRAERR